MIEQPRRVSSLKNISSFLNSSNARMSVAINHKLYFVFKFFLKNPKSNTTGKWITELKPYKVDSTSEEKASKS